MNLKEIKKEIKMLFSEQKIVEDKIVEGLKSKKYHFVRTAPFCEFLTDANENQLKKMRKLRKISDKDLHFKQLDLIECTRIESYVLCAMFGYSFGNVFRNKGE